MANAEIWDYLSATPVTPDYDAFLSLTPQRILVEAGQKNQIVHLADDDSESIVSFSDDSIFYITLQWEHLTEADAGTLFDFYHATAKANGMARSFKWTHPGETDSHTYIIRFASALSRKIRPGFDFGFASIKFKILGRAA